MIARREGARALQRPKIGDSFDDDQQLPVAPSIAADRAWVARIDVAAFATDDNALARNLHRLGERPQQLLTLADQMQRGAARRARAEARQTRQQLDQALDLRPGDTFSHFRMAA